MTTYFESNCFWQERNECATHSVAYIIQAVIVSHFKLLTAAVIVQPPSTCHSKPWLTIGCHTPPFLPFWWETTLGYVSLYSTSECHCWPLKNTPSRVVQSSFGVEQYLRAFKCQDTGGSCYNWTVYTISSLGLQVKYTTTTLHESCLWQLSSGPIVIMAYCYRHTRPFVWCDGFDWVGADGVMSTPQVLAIVSPLDTALTYTWIWIWVSFDNK